MKQYTLIKITFIKAFMREKLYLVRWKMNEFGIALTHLLSTYPSPSASDEESFQ